jgi:hypothetical protein
MRIALHRSLNGGQPGHQHALLTGMDTTQYLGIVATPMHGCRPRRYVLFLAVR